MGKKPTYAELEQRIIKSERRLNIVADFTYSWEYWIGPASNLLFISPSCQKHTGYTADEFLSNDDLILDIVHPEDKKRIAQHFKHEQRAPLIEPIEFWV